MVEGILTAEEFRNRTIRAQEVLAKTDLDAFLVFSTESEPAGVRYFSNYWPSFVSRCSTSSKVRDLFPIWRYSL